MSPTLLMWVTSLTDRRDHAVRDTDMESGLAAGRGEFLAVCGRTVRIGSLYEPPGPYCSDCQDATAPPPQQRRRGLRAWLGAR